MSRNNQHDKVPRIPPRNDNRIGRRPLVEKIGRTYKQTMNHLINYRFFNPVFMMQGYAGMVDSGTFWAMVPGKAKRDSSTPKRRLAIVTETRQHDDSLTNKKLTYVDQTLAAGWDAVNVTQTLVTQTAAYDEVPNKRNMQIWTQGENQLTSAWEDFLYTPGALVDLVQVQYQNMKFFGIGLFEIPSNEEEMTSLQNGLENKAVDYNKVIKGNDGAQAGLNYGDLWNLLGQRSSTDATVEAMTQRNWQYCHPKGIYLTNFAAYQNIFNKLTIKIKPREIRQDTLGVNYLASFVVRSDAATLRVRNVTTGASITAVVGGLFVPTLVTLGTIRAQRHQYNEFVFEVVNAGDGAATVVHSVSLFEQSPFNAV